MSKKITLQISASVDVQEFLYDLGNYNQSNKALLELAEGLIEQVNIDRPDLVRQLVKRWSMVVAEQKTGKKS